MTVLVAERGSVVLLADGATAGGIEDGTIVAHWFDREMESCVFVCVAVQCLYVLLCSTSSQKLE